MELIYTDKNQIEQGFLANTETDIDFGDTEDFEVTVSIADNVMEYGSYIFCDGTEYGGIVGGRAVDTARGTITYTGKTWRGMLKAKILCPQENQDYYAVSGTFSSICNQLLAYCRLDQVMEYDNNSTDFNIGSYQFPRYENLLHCMEKMLKSKGKRLEMIYTLGKVLLSAKDIADHSAEIEFSEDGNITFKIEEKRDGINHLICLGKGELKQRQVIHLYLQKDGTIGDQQDKTGPEEVAETYDYSNAESLEDLREKGTEEFLNRITGDNLEVSVSDIDVALRDIVGGREYITGAFIKKEITQKIINISSNGNVKISYKVGG